MKVAHIYANLSSSQRAKVGCVVVKKNKILSIGYNGTTEGWHTNVCEDESGKTKPDVVHAEVNCLGKLAREGGGARGAILFTTLSPCINCAKFIFVSGIKKVYFSEKYRDDMGVVFLKERGVKVKQLKKEKKKNG